MSTAGAIVWSELMTRDLSRAKAHYAAVAGWGYTEAEMPDGVYTMAMSGEAPVMAGLWEMAGPQFEGVADHWMTYIAVPDVDAAATAAEADGATVLRPPFDVPNTGRIAVLHDPGGAPYGIMTPAEG